MLSRGDVDGDNEVLSPSSHSPSSHSASISVTAWRAAFSSTIALLFA
jgi:hypothetical protein